MKEYALASDETAYEYQGEQALVGFMIVGVGFHDGNVSHWRDQKHPSFTSHN